MSKFPSRYAPLGILIIWLPSPLTGMHLSTFAARQNNWLRCNKNTWLGPATLGSHGKLAATLTILPPRSRNKINSYLWPTSIFNLPYLQLLVRSYELVLAVFFNNSFETKLLTRRKLALLTFKIDGLNLHQIKPPDPSVVSIGIGRPSMPPDAATFHIPSIKYDVDIWGILLSG